MNINTIALDQPPGPKASNAPHGGNGGFQVAYARVLSDSYAPRARDASGGIDKSATGASGIDLTQPWHGEGAVTHEPFADFVPRMQDVDLAELALGPIRRAVPEQIPHLGHRRVEVD